MKLYVVVGIKDNKVLTICGRHSESEALVRAIELNNDPIYGPYSNFGILTVDDVNSYHLDGLGRVSPITELGYVPPREVVGKLVRTNKTDMEIK